MACGSPKPLPAPQPTALCEGLPHPVLGAKPTTTSTGRASIAVIGDRVLFTAIGYGSFPDHQVTTTQAFELVGDQVKPLGELARGETQFARGGAVWKTATGFATCSRTLPSLGNELHALAVDGDHVLALSGASAPNANCKGLTSGVRGTIDLGVYELDLRGAEPFWELPTPGLNIPVEGQGCRGLVVVGADAHAHTAAIETCTYVDAGDSISSQDCSLAVWFPNALTTPLTIDTRDTITLGGTRVAVTPLGGDSRMYRVENGHLIGEGIVEGSVIAIDGTRVIAAKSGGNRPGSIGVGFQIRAYDARQPTTDWLDVDNVRDLAFAWVGDRIVGVLPEDQRGRDPVTARVVEARNGKWRDIATANVIVAP